MAVKTKTPSSVNQTSSTNLVKKSSVSSSSKTVSQKDDVKPKLVIVNNTKSAFTDIVKPSTSCEESSGSSNRNSKPNLLKKDSTSIKRKRTAVIYDSDSESESGSLDFGSENVKSNKPKLSKHVSYGRADSVKKSLVKQSTNSTSVKSSSPVLIDGDVEMSGDLKEVNFVNGDKSRPDSFKRSYSLTEEDKAAAVCLIDSDSDFE